MSKADGHADKVVLVGFMGAGKSSAARALGERAVDVDEEIEARSGRPVQAIFAQDGEAAFRELEEQVTLELLDSPIGVVALGGGATNSARVRAALERHTVVLLDIEADEAWRRVQGGGSKRPLAADKKGFYELYDARRPGYEQLADVVVPSTCAREIADVLPSLDGLAALPGKTRMLWATASSGDYPVYIGSGLLTRDKFWPAQLSGRRALITDYNAARHYADLLSPVMADIRIMPGEQSKTVAHAEIVWTEMARNGVTRSDIVVALGGGVIGDLAGFCAATYQRGVGVVQLPTTLVAQVDSAYGGKTGVDLAEAKNYVGAFHQPLAVITDPTTLATLPAEEVAAGYAEVVKTGLIAGGSLWQKIADGADPTDEEVITGCALTKLRIVGQDERDGGVRQLLNLGHTVGHAIETATGYARYRHGEAVGLGLLAALRLSGADQLRAQVRGLLLARGLPVSADGVDLDAVIFNTGKDKKRIDAGPTPFVLCSAPGAAVAGATVTPADLRAAVKELLAGR